METRALRSLVRLSELGTLTRCAEALNLSAAAVHKQLKGLESDLDVRLYERVGRRLRLTQASEVLLPHARNLLADHDMALSAVREWKGAKHGSVRVGTGPTLSSYLLPSLLEEFRRLHPGVELFVETGHIHELVQGLTAGALDVLILVSSRLTEQPTMVVEKEWDYEIVFVSGKRTSTRPRRMACLSNAPFILYKNGGLFESHIDTYFSEARLTPRVAMRFDNAEAIKAMTRLGLGISGLPMWIVDAELRERRLFVIRLEERPLIGQLSLVRRRSGYLPKPVSAFVELAQQWQWKGVRLLNR
jgi:LysR family hydrogen peroxide-inducible transcriptional activator